MNFSNFIGFIASFTIFGAAVYTSSKNFAVLLDTHAILIVVGGTFAATTICFSLPKVFGLVRVFIKRMLGKSKKDYLAIIDQIVTLSAANRRGRQAFEAAITGKVVSL